MGIGVYRASIFLSAFLLFLVQPMVSKMLLPVFGGSYLVWGTCMVFFQGVLLLGYIYSHFVQRCFRPKQYARYHWLLLVAGFIAFPFRFERFEGFLPGGHPAIDVVVHLALLLIVPFFALSTMSVLIQRWLSLSSLPEKDHPYALYSPSNLGSLLALLCYPTVVEPMLNLRQQAWLWWGGYALLFLLHFLCLPRRGDEPVPTRAANADPLPKGEKLRWFLLSAAGSATLLAVTNVITFDVASFPFLWVLPLSIYLLTFVLAFKLRPWFPRWVESGLSWTVALAAILSAMSGMRLSVPVLAVLMFHPAILFFVCMNCHVVLARRKPVDPAYLTLFYLFISLGGFCGSVLVNWVIPLLSSTPVEYLLAISLALGALAKCSDAPRKYGIKATAFGAVLVLAALTGMPALLGRRMGLEPATVMAASVAPVLLVMRYFKDRPMPLAVLVLATLAASFGTERLMYGTAEVLRLRNFYGIYKVYDHDGIRYLKHGSTLHGREYLDAARAVLPLSYHHPAAPAGELLRSGLIAPRRAAMIGLGTGAMATYFRNGQEFVIYELDPDNLPIAEKQFEYLSSARANGANLRFIVGDGRLSLRREMDGVFDLLVIDAFNSGSIPVHLLTREALSEYMRVLSPGGIVLLHISNRALNLEPLVFSLAHSIGAHAVAKRNDDTLTSDADPSDWMAVTRDPVLAENLVSRLSWRKPGGLPLPEPWTDQYGNLLWLMVWK